MNLFWNYLKTKEYIYSRKNSIKLIKEIFSNNFQNNNFYITSSGRSAISLFLESIELDRHDEIFIPKYLSKCVIDSILTQGMPSLRYNDNVKTVLIYHQYGFPQDIDEILKKMKSKKIIIEDCAHSVSAKYKGENIGNFGDVAVFSPSKYLSSTYFGILKTNKDIYKKKIQELLDYEDEFKKLRSLVNIFNNFYYVYNYNFSKGNLLSNLILEKWYTNLNLIRSLKSIKINNIKSLSDYENNINNHKKKFQFLSKNYKNISLKFIKKYDDISELAPMCFPYISEDNEKLERICKYLKTCGFKIGIYNFDINRNLFEPNFNKCVLIPLHSRMKLEMLEKLIYV